MSNENSQSYIFKNIHQILNLNPDGLSSNCNINFDGLISMEIADLPVDSSKVIPRRYFLLLVSPQESVTIVTINLLADELNADMLSDVDPITDVNLVDQMAQYLKRFCIGDLLPTVYERVVVEFGCNDHNEEMVLITLEPATDDDLVKFRFTTTDTHAFCKRYKHALIENPVSTFSIINQCIVSKSAFDVSWPDSIKNAMSGIDTNHRVYMSELNLELMMFSTDTSRVAVLAPLVTHLTRYLEVLKKKDA